MRLNNGTTKGSASSRRSSSRNRTTPRRETEQSRLEISDEFLNPPTEASDSDDLWEPSSVTSRSRRRTVVGKGVNDLRSSPAPSNHSNDVSVKTRGSSVSRASSVTLRRRLELAAENEPHPYGLEPRGAPISPTSPVRSSVTSTFRRNQLVEESTTNAAYYKSSERRTISSLSLGDHCENRSSVTRRVANNEQNYLSANNNNKSASYLSRLLGRQNIDCPFSSDSETSVNGDRDAQVPTSTSYISVVWRNCKKFVSYLCSWIYLLLMGSICLEKWFLRGKSSANQDGREVNGLSYSPSSEGQNEYNYNMYNRNSSSQRSNSSSIVFFTALSGNSRSQSQVESNSGNGNFWLLNRFKTSNTNNETSQEKSRFMTWIGSVFKTVGNWLHSTLVTLFLLLLLFGGLYLLYGAWPLWKGFESASGNDQSSSSSVLKSNDDTFGGSKVSTEKAAQPLVPPTVPSSVMMIERDAFLQETNALKKESKETLAVLKLTQESIDALKIKIGAMEQTISEHDIRLTAHDDSLKTVESEIRKIMEAMKAATTKEKTIEQIIAEVLNVQVGETTEGKPVTLKSMFTILKEKDDVQRISLEIETKLRSLYADVGKMQQNFDEATDQVASFMTDLNELNTRITRMENVVEEQRDSKVEVEMDVEKVKEVVLPVLTKEIEEAVAISCKSRNCPESSIYYGLSAEDIELMIKRAISKYDADKTGLPDLALESAGGSILSTRCTKSSELRNSVISYWGFRLWSPPNTPRTIIQPGVVPGECWAFEGSVGDVVIKLAVPSVVTAFTLEHIPKTISRYGLIDSAPKHFQVLGLVSEHDTEEVHDYGTFTYEDNDEPLQYFPVKNATARPYPIVELKVLSNHGNMKHTCIYRFRVHGAIDLSRSHRLVKSKSVEDGTSSGSSN